ncbi:FKBP-type peptidyl-prolyl cis-trans isomerase [uncultured Shewanella sp.]|uniref:FKBP-type peptidyl-prolyl cis-trans isomerase n=1 Tax=uncultured Shewanella sp. TaxID=173975 RepID=UPI00260C99D2|nr:FKBP-type peptidyl-prolyl cis-trans isomerase [uncultured Shewanella sp.]
MKVFKKSILAISCLPLFLSVQCIAETELSADNNKESYSIGASFGNYISSQLYSQTQLGAEVDVDIVVEGLLDALKGKSKLSDEDILSYLNIRVEKLNAAKEEKDKDLALKNLVAGEKFLADNKKSADVRVTESGLQYEIISQGSGAMPQANDVVTVHYKGYLIDGTEFDNSYSRDEPNRFSLVTVIEGWQEGLQLMKEGAKYKFNIPSELAYGERQVGVISPNSALVFEVELVKVEAPGENSHGMGLSLSSMGGMGMGGMMGANPHK